MRQVFSFNSLLLTNEELYALEERYNDDMGFNYYTFLRDIAARKLEEPLVRCLIYPQWHILFWRIREGRGVVHEIPRPVATDYS